MTKHEVFRARPRRFRVLAGLVAVVVIGTATVAVAANARKGRDEGNPAPLSAFVRIQDVPVDAGKPRARDDASTGVSTVDCGTNGNRKFWPVGRIDEQAGGRTGADGDTLKAAGTPTISCPAVADRLPAIPDRARDEVDRDLRSLEEQISEAGKRLAANRDASDPDFVNTAVLGPLRDKRVATTTPSPTARRCVDGNLPGEVEHGGLVIRHRPHPARRVTVRR